MASDSILQLITNSSRPFRSFVAEIKDPETGEKRDIELFTRRLSTAETDAITSAYTTEFQKIQDQYSEDQSDLSVIKRNFEKQPIEKLAKFVTESDRGEYLAEASSELDDLPYNNPKVIELADQKQQEAQTLLEGAPKEEILQQAIERRAFVLASIRAMTVQNQHLLYYSVYVDDNGAKTRLFPDVDTIAQELDAETIGYFLGLASETLAREGRTMSNPLASAPRKRSRKRTRSQNTSVEA